MSELQIAINLPKSTYMGGERVEGTLLVKIPATAGDTVKIPGIVINASSRTTIAHGKGIAHLDHQTSHGSIDSDDNKTLSSTIAEPYRQQLRVIMPRGGESTINLLPGTTKNYPFALILPPDVFPSYYCATTREEDGEDFVARLAYTLTADVAAVCGVRVDTTPAELLVAPVALPYGPQPRKGYVIPVYNSAPPPEGDEDIEEAATAAAKGKKEDKKKCKKGQKAEEVRPPARVGQVKVSLAMQTAYICLRPNTGKNADNINNTGNGDDVENTMWVEVRLSNQLHTENLPFQVRLSLKLVTKFKPQDGSEPVENVITLATRTAKAVNANRSGDNTLELKPGEATPMRLSLTVPQLLALNPCELHPAQPAAGTGSSSSGTAGASAGARRAKKTTLPVPPTVETAIFDARTVLEVEISALEGRTRNDGHIVVLDDPVEIVGLPDVE